MLSQQKLYEVGLIISVLYRGCALVVTNPPTYAGDVRDAA